ncbi:transcriptional regulator TetR family [Patulibacter medicamentivorans]|uniref:Transcriptional regulator TetR family n=1 Tax=Patulibacter medicamentivorans TaxID=1097667 RepID=H0E6C1_9ACTN|nr:TetR/AcrR family transcriptional regulator [Patulibacter medicamentivorans]EHN10765.1 transcriptional regulator TetR family [Patulibacter medicamentivorans]
MATARLTAEERREQVLEVATTLVAARGFDATPTAAIAEGAGISHAYLFRLFPAKLDLVRALVARCNARVEHVMDRAATEARAAGEEPLPAMGRAYSELLADRDQLLLQLHAHAASPTMPEVREAMRESFERLSALVRREADVTPEEVRAFFAQGMLCNVMAALDLYGVDADWARTLTGAPPWSDDESCAPPRPEGPPARA